MKINWNTMKNVGNRCSISSLLPHAYVIFTWFIINWISRTNGRESISGFLNPLTRFIFKRKILLRKQDVRVPLFLLFSKSQIIFNHRFLTSLVQFNCFVQSGHQICKFPPTFVMPTMWSFNSPPLIALGLYILGRFIFIWWVLSSRCFGCFLSPLQTHKDHVLQGKFA